MQGMFRYHPVDLGGGCLHHPPLTQALDRLPGNKKVEKGKERVAST